MNTNLQWPYIQPNTSGYTYTFGTYPTLEQIRQVIQEELAKAFQPERDLPSVAVDVMVDGKRYTGLAYLTEEDEA